MMTRIPLGVALLIVFSCASLLMGCDKSSSEATPAVVIETGAEEVPADEPRAEEADEGGAEVALDTVRPPRFKAEAREQITLENVEDTIKELEREIAAELAEMGKED